MVGVVLVGAGQVVSLDSMVEGISLGSGEAAGAVGLGQMMGLLGGLLTLLAQLDDLMQLFGGLALALSVVVLGVYAWSRERVLVVGVAGGEDIVLSAPDDEDVVDQVRAAVLPGDAPADAARSTPVDDLLP
ncbi:hypothetical protein ACFQH8_02285 [Halomicroarcula sp. GCM10025710]